MTPIFLPGSAGKVFAIHRRAQGASATGVLIVPPFAEEMNKSRRQFSILANRLSAAGCDSLLVDLFGTGDSQGDFEDATWETWVADCTAGAAWLLENGAHSIQIWGTRLGGLLALETAAGLQGSVERVVLWQPVTTGRAALQHFLRLGAMAKLMVGGEAAGGTKQLLAELDSGSVVEVAGYSLTPTLCNAIMARELVALGGQVSGPIDVFEIANRQQPSPALSRAIEQWNAKGIAASVEVIGGAQFWATSEISNNKELVEASVRANGIA